MFPSLSKFLIKVLTLMLLAGAVIALLGCTELNLVNRSVETINHISGVETLSQVQGSGTPSFVEQVKSNILIISLSALILSLLYAYLKLRGAFKGVVGGVETFKVSSDTNTIERLYDSLRTRLNQGQRNVIKSFRPKGTLS